MQFQLHSSFYALQVPCTWEFPCVFLEFFNLIALLRHITPLSSVLMITLLGSLYLLPQHNTTFRDIPSIQIKAKKSKLSHLPVFKSTLYIYFKFFNFIFWHQLFATRQTLSFSCIRLTLTLATWQLRFTLCFLLPTSEIMLKFCLHCSSSYKLILVKNYRVDEYLKCTWKQPVKCSLPPGHEKLT